MRRSSLIRLAKKRYEKKGAMLKFLRKRGIRPTKKELEILGRRGKRPTRKKLKKI